VDGTVGSRPAAPSSPWRATAVINSGAFIAGPSASPINVTSISLSTDATSGSGIPASLLGQHVPNSATSCSGATVDELLWQIRDQGDGVTPLSFSFPTPLQYKPPANRKACLFAVGQSAQINAVGFYCG
jgi:hypothetical protein